MSHFEEMARKREEEASLITDIEVWKSVVSKAVILDVDSNIKADILLQAIPDIGVIFSQLKVQNKLGVISDFEYHSILKICIEKLEDRMAEIDFDPLKYRES